jgi:hypothetical protein
MVALGGDPVRSIGAVLMARRTVIDQWFVSVEMPRPSRGTRRSARQTKSFPTEAEAKQYAKAMVAEGNKIMAGTLLRADQPVRRIISGSELYRWIEEKDES